MRYNIGQFIELSLKIQVFSDKEKADYEKSPFFLHSIFYLRIDESSKNRNGSTKGIDRFNWVLEDDD